MIYYVRLYNHQKNYQNAKHKNLLYFEAIIDKLPGFKPRICIISDLFSLLKNIFHFYCTIYIFIIDTEIHHFYPNAASEDTSHP